MIDVFKVGVHIGMSTNSGQVLAAMLRQLTGVEASQKAINANFQKMAALAGGAMAAIGGAAALKGLWSIVEASKKLNDELTKLKSLGGDFEKNLPGIRRDALGVSQQVGGSFGFSASVRAYRETIAQLNSKDEADQVLPYVLKAATVASQVTGEKPEDMIRNFMRMLDARGALTSERADGSKVIDVQKMIPELNAMVSALRIYAGQITSKGMFNAAQMSSVPIKTMTREAFYADMMESAAAGSPHRVGTAMTGFYTQMVGGTMPLRVAEEMQRMGMLKQGEWKQGKGGQVLLAPSATSRAGQIMKDPIAYITGPLNDLMNKKGMNDEQKIQEIFKLFGRQTVQRLAAEAISSEPQYARSRSMFKGTTPIEEAFAMLQKENLQYNIDTFSSSWTSLIEALGNAGVPTAIALLQKMTGALNEMTKWVEAHPDAAAALLSVAGGLAALVALGGGLTVLSLGLSGLVAPLTALASIPGLAAVGGGLATVAGGLSALVPAVAAAAAMLGLLKLGSDNETPENRAKIEQQKRDMFPHRFDRFAPQDGYDAMGRPIPQPQGGGPASGPGGLLGRISYNGGDEGRIMGDVYLDGQKVGQWMSRWMATQMQRPSAAPTWVDPRRTAIPPGGATI